jgi:hypothetical protein
MTKKNKDGISQLADSAVGPSESCTLELSADAKWMRLIVGGKLTSAFHVEYVRKVLASSVTEVKRQHRRNSEVPIDL